VETSKNAEKFMVLTINRCGARLVSGKKPVIVSPTIKANRRLICIPEFKTKSVYQVVDLFLCCDFI